MKVVLKEKIIPSKKTGFVIEWKRKSMSDEGSQSEKIVGFAHPGCCGKSGGGCPKKHG